MPEAKPLPDTETNLRETIDFVLRILRSRKLLILGCAALLAVLTAAVSPLVPKKYKSEALILIVRQEVPERYVTPTSTTTVSEEVAGMAEEVLSRTRLMVIIDDLHLYANERKTQAPEEIVEKMRKKIDIKPLMASDLAPNRKDFSAFKIAFSAQDPQIAQDVTSRLTSLFIQENLKNRQDQATNTADFLSSQLDTVKKKLDDQEARLRDYKLQHIGELPEQQQGNMAILGALQAQLQNTVSAEARNEEQKAYLESILNNYRDFAARAAANGPVSHTATPLEQAQAQLKHLQSLKAQLLEIYKPAFPEVVKVERAIARQQIVVQDLESQEAAAKASSPASSATENKGYEMQTAQIKSQLEVNQMEMGKLKKDEQRLKNEMDLYQNKINQAPVREQQLADVVRDNQLVKQNYADLLNKKQQSQLAASLEKQEQGQHFRLIDPPSLPKAPSGPPPIAISAGGALFGLIIGVGIAFLLEMKKNAFQSEKDVMKSLGLVLVLEVPTLLTAPEKKRRNWKSAIEAVASCVLVLVIGVAEYYVYSRG